MCDSISMTASSSSTFVYKAFGSVFSASARSDDWRWNPALHESWNFCNSFQTFGRLKIILRNRWVGGNISAIYFGKPLRFRSSGIYWTDITSPTFIGVNVPGALSEIYRMTIPGEVPATTSPCVASAEPCCEHSGTSLSSLCTFKFKVCLQAWRTNKFSITCDTTPRQVHDLWVARSVRWLGSCNTCRM